MIQYTSAEIDDIRRLALTLASDMRVVTERLRALEAEAVPAIRQPREWWGTYDHRTDTWSLVPAITFSRTEGATLLREVI